MVHQEKQKDHLSTKEGSRMVNRQPGLELTSNKLRLEENWGGAGLARTGEHTDLSSKRRCEKGKRILGHMGAEELKLLGTQEFKDQRSSGERQHRECPRKLSVEGSGGSAQAHLEVGFLLRLKRGSVGGGGGGFFLEGKKELEEGHPRKEQTVTPKKTSERKSLKANKRSGTNTSPEKASGKNSRKA